MEETDIHLLVCNYEPREWGREPWGKEARAKGRAGLDTVSGRGSGLIWGPISWGYGWHRMESAHRSSKLVQGSKTQGALLEKAYKGGTGSGLAVGPCPQHPPHLLQGTEGQRPYQEGTHAPNVPWATTAKLPLW